MAPLERHFRRHGQVPSQDQPEVAAKRREGRRHATSKRAPEGLWFVRPMCFPICTAGDRRHLRLLQSGNRYLGAFPLN